MKILIVEDNAASVIYLKKILSYYGECSVAIDGIEAIKEVVCAYEAKTPYDLVYLDIMLPRMDGIQVLSTIQEIYKQENGFPIPKIIMISALNDQKTVEKVTAIGCDAYLWKPASIEKIESVLQELGFMRKK